MNLMDGKIDVLLQIFYKIFYYMCKYVVWLIEILLVKLLTSHRVSEIIILAY